jgi:hypothetical protein
MDDRRRILFHAFAMLTVAFALGLVAGALGPLRHPHARLWLGAHLTGILIGILMLAFGLARPHLTLGRRASRAFTWSLLWGNWAGLAILGIFGSAMGIGTPIITPQLPAPTGWKAAVIGVTLLFVTVTTFITCLTGLWGARASAQTAARQTAVGQG